MNMQMQMGIEQLFGMIMGRMQQIEISSHQMLQNNNIIFRLLFQKGIITEDDITDAIKKEFEINKALGISETPSEDDINGMKDNIILWAKGDIETLKKQVEEYKKEVEKELKTSRIQTVSADALNALDNMNKGAPGKSKLIL